MTTPHEGRRAYGCPLVASALPLPVAVVAFRIGTTLGRALDKLSQGRVGLQGLGHRAICCLPQPLAASGGECANMCGLAVLPVVLGSPDHELSTDDGVQCVGSAQARRARRVCPRSARLPTQ